MFDEVTRGVEAFRVTVIMGNMQPDVLFVTLDSTRYDAFMAASTPNMKAVGPTWRAWAPSHFTYGSHSAFFVGFTPGVPELAKPYVNPKFGRIFRLQHGGAPGLHPAYFLLNGRTIVEGFRNQGYLCLGTGAVRWFNPATPAGQSLTEDFDEFLYLPSPDISLQVEWILEKAFLSSKNEKPVFAFLNAGETHVPYWHPGASWDRSYNPAEAFGSNNNAQEARRRQIQCLEWIDQKIQELLFRFRRGAIVLCSDHGDCWGEDGLWEHGIHHRYTLEVPLIFSLPQRAEAL
jgi:hypothetical protein